MSRKGVKYQRLITSRSPRKLPGLLLLVPLAIVVGAMFIIGPRAASVSHSVSNKHVNPVEVAKGLTATGDVDEDSPSAEQSTTASTSGSTSVSTPKSTSTNSTTTPSTNGTTKQVTTAKPATTPNTSNVDTDHDSTATGEGDEQVSQTDCKKLVQSLSDTLTTTTKDAQALLKHNLGMVGLDLGLQNNFIDGYNKTIKSAYDSSVKSAQNAGCVFTVSTPVVMSHKKLL